MKKNPKPNGNISLSFRRKQKLVRFKEIKTKIGLPGLNRTILTDKIARGDANFFKTKQNKTKHKRRD